jgi:tRNA(fMet)-specific endonuclease VapC
MIRRYLLDTGIMQQIDMQIGAIARTLPNCVVVSKDSDLSAIPGIAVENWAL